MKKITSILIILFSTLVVKAQNGTNNVSEVTNYKDANGLIVVELTINGHAADFVLDINGRNTILAEYVDKLEFKEIQPLPLGYTHNKLTSGAAETAIASAVTMGNNISSDRVSFAIIADENNELRNLNVAGTLNAAIFLQSIVTINTQRKTITTSTPVRPVYMGLKNRVNMKFLANGYSVTAPVMIDNKQVDCLLDTYNKSTIALAEKPSTVSELKFVNAAIPSSEIDVLSEGSQAIAGLGLLQHGILSLDFPHSKAYFQTFEETEIRDEVEIQLVTIVPGTLNEIGRAEFLEYIFDYKNDKDFVLKGDKPVVIDFWASWCGPCLRLMPQMEQFADKYKDQVVFYKVNADKEKEICAKFNIQALPTLFFIPKGGAPIVEVGAIPEKYIEIIETKLLNLE